MNATVTVTGLRKKFGSMRALDDVDVAFAPGVNGLLGPNGAGKTTMLRILATAMAADSGQIDIFGHDQERAPGFCDLLQDGKEVSNV